MTEKSYAPNWLVREVGDYLKKKRTVADIGGSEKYVPASERDIRGFAEIANDFIYDRAIAKSAGANYARMNSLDRRKIFDFILDRESERMGEMVKQRKKRGLQEIL